MNIAWYLGFGWISIVLCLTFGLASYYYSTGWIHWFLYALFVIMFAYIVTKFRLYWREPWRRINTRGMGIFNKLIKQQAADAPEDSQELDMAGLCRQLAEQLLGEKAGSELASGELFTDEGRRGYYRQLVETNPQLFTHRLKEEHRAAALSSILKDIDASELGPDLVIAVAIEQKYGRFEATRFLLALASGLTMRKGLFQ